MYLFFFNDTATTEIYTLSLHDALPIYRGDQVAQHVGDHRPGQRRDAGDGEHLEPVEDAGVEVGAQLDAGRDARREDGLAEDRKSTRLNSSHANISYAVFCLKKKNDNLRLFALALGNHAHLVAAVHLARGVASDLPAARSALALDQVVLAPGHVVAVQHVHSL